MKDCRALRSQASGKKHINLETFLKNVKMDKGISAIMFKKKGIPGIKLKEAFQPTSMYVEKGDNFEPYLIIRKLFLSAKNDIIMIDPYINDQVLQMIPLLPKKICFTIFSDKISPSDFLTQVKKLRKDGYQIHIFRTKEFHDRFLSIDGKWWHSGHSFKDLGGNDSFLSRMDDKNSLTKLHQRVQSIILKGNEYYIE
jgi:hypothetical protein